jgi:5-deoxy-D-glucuronate isomerase
MAGSRCNDHDNTVITQIRVLEGASRSVLPTMRPLVVEVRRPKGAVGSVPVHKCDLDALSHVAG